MLSEKKKQVTQDCKYYDSNSLKFKDKKNYKNVILDYNNLLKNYKAEHKIATHKVQEHGFFFEGDGKESTFKHEGSLQY